MSTARRTNPKRPQKWFLILYLCKTISNMQRSPIKDKALNMAFFIAQCTFVNISSDHWNSNSLQTDKTNAHTHTHMNICTTKLQLNAVQARLQFYNLCTKKICFDWTLRSDDRSELLGPYTALAAVIKDSANTALPGVGSAPCAHIETASVIWVGVGAIGLIFAEATSWDGNCGLGRWSGGGATRSVGCRWGWCGSTCYGFGGGGNDWSRGCYGFGACRRDRSCGSSARFLCCGWWDWWDVWKR